MTHDIKTGEGNMTVAVPLVYVVGPINDRVSLAIKEVIFPSASKIWAFSFWCAGGMISVFFPDDQGGALLERARLVEAMNLVKSTQDASNMVDILRAEKKLQDGA